MKINRTLAPKIGRLKASNQAWMLIELLRIAQFVRQKSMCLGEIRVRHILFKEVPLSNCSVSLSPSTVSLSPSTVSLSRRKKENHLLRLYDGLGTIVHEKFLHDDGCHLIGVSRRSLIKLIKQTALNDQEQFLIEAIEEALTEHSLERSDLSCLELVYVKITERITPHKPSLG